MEKYCRAGQAADDSMVHAHCMLDILGCKHVFRICNIYCFSTATVVAQICLNVMLYVYYLSSYFCPHLYQLQMILLSKREHIVAMENAQSCYLFFLYMNCFEKFNKYKTKVYQSAHDNNWW